MSCVLFEASPRHGLLLCCGQLIEAARCMLAQICSACKHACAACCSRSCVWWQCIMSICASGAALVSVPTRLRVILAYQVIRAFPGTLRDTTNLQKAYSWQPTRACHTWSACQGTPANWSTGPCSAQSAYVPRRAYSLDVVALTLLQLEL